MQLWQRVFSRLVIPAMSPAWGSFEYTAGDATAVPHEAFGRGNNRDVGLGAIFGRGRIAAGFESWVFTFFVVSLDSYPQRLVRVSLRQKCRRRQLCT